MAYIKSKSLISFPVELCSDKHGLLALSEKQAKRLKSWMRPDEFMESPKLVNQIDSGTIKQVTSCCFLFFPEKNIILY